MKNELKNELKTLYRKDKKLALKVAKVLGFKINVNAKLMTKKEALSNLSNAAETILNTMNTLADEVDLPEKIEKLSLGVLDKLTNLRVALKKL